MSQMMPLVMGLFLYVLLRIGSSRSTLTDRSISRTITSFILFLMRNFVLSLPLLLDKLNAQTEGDDSGNLTISLKVLNITMFL